ncbi:MAG: preprotein translocase subunit SecE [Proteobacteria bacterium]|nr:preprotein translocase subunit SecE [Pseudomonadota bacterium]
MGSSKWVHVIFLVVGLLLAFVAVQTIDWIWGLFGRPIDLVVILAGGALAGGATVYVWRQPATFERANEVVAELSKVTWPTRKETKAATMVVIVTAAVASLVLSLFDVIWSWATALIYT